MNHDNDLPLPPEKEDFDFWNNFDAEILRLKLIKERDYIHKEWQAGRVSRWNCGKILAGFNCQIYEIENQFAASNYEPFDLSFVPAVVVPEPVAAVVVEPPKKARKKKIEQKEDFFK